MEAVRQTIDDANKALMQSVEGLDAQLRPVQRAFFTCGITWTAEKNTAMEVGDGIARCQEPMQGVQGLLQDAQSQFQDRIRACHELAGKALDPSGPASRGRPSEEEMSKYAAALRPCVQGEIGRVGELMSPVYDAVPKALAAIHAVTPEGAPRMDAVGGKKGWW